MKKQIKNKTLMKYLIVLGICNYLSMSDAYDLVIRIKFLKPSNNETIKEESNPNRL